MPPKLDGAIPLTALRDLVGVCRVLYAEWTCNNADPLELEELAHIGLELAHALKLARGTAPNTVGHRSAWARAEAATARLGALVEKTDALRATVHAATVRVVGEPEAPSLKSKDERDAKKHHTRMRS